MVALVCALAASHAQTTAPKIREPKHSNQALAGGKRVFESVCASCHGLNGKGGERAPDIATKPEVVKLSDSETSKILREGILQKGMPAFATLGPAKLSQVLSYLRILQGKGKNAAVVPQTPKRAKNFLPARAAVCNAIWSTARVDFSAPIFPITEQAIPLMISATPL